MKQFFIKINHADRLVHMTGVDISKVTFSLPISPDNLLLLCNYGDIAQFDSRLCAFYAEGKIAKQVLCEGPATREFGFVDYQNNTRNYLSETEFNRFLTAAERFTVIGTPFSPTLKNQYLFLSRGDESKLYLKNLDRFLPILNHILLWNMQPEEPYPVDAGNLRRLGTLCENGALFRLDEQTGTYHIAVTGSCSPEQTRLLLANPMPSNLPRLDLFPTAKGHWRLTSLRQEELATHY